MFIPSAEIRTFTVETRDREHDGVAAVLRNNGVTTSARRSTTTATFTLTRDDVAALTYHGAVDETGTLFGSNGDRVALLRPWF